MFNKICKFSKIILIFREIKPEMLYINSRAFLEACWAETLDAREFSKNVCEKSIKPSNYKIISYHIRECIINNPMCI